jgi:hypothetical protein
MPPCAAHENAQAGDTARPLRLRSGRRMITEAGMKGHAIRARY